MRRAVGVLTTCALFVGCGGDDQADHCADAVIDWEGGPSPYRTEAEATAGFVRDFPELGRFAELEVADGRIRSGGVVIGSYELERLADGTVGVAGAEWCYDDPTGPTIDD